MGELEKIYWDLWMFQFVAADLDETEKEQHRAIIRKHIVKHLDSNVPGGGTLRELLAANGNAREYLQTVVGLGNILFLQVEEAPPIIPFPGTHQGRGNGGK